MGGANLVDANGEVIYSNEDHWYKIVLADGSEIGLGEPYPSSQSNGRTLVKIVPAAQGMVFRYQRTDGGGSGYGWPQGDKGWLRGVQVKADGSEVIKNMSLSWEPTKICMYDDNSNYGFTAQQLPGNRVALYAYNRHGTICGLRVTPDNGVIGYESGHALCLDCAFVRVGSHFKGLF